MNPSIELQKQIKDNAEDVRKFVSDLSNWEEEMKRKESAAQAAASKESSLPPVRNSHMKQDSNNSKANSPLGDSRNAKKRISSNDYAAWEKFDVEKACEEVDDPSLKSESEEDKTLRENQLRDEANVEKEKGNQFVKKEKWDNAIECYSKAIKCFPRDAIFYCNRALCYLKKKDYRAAETDCTSALTLDSSYVKALHRRALARKELNQFNEALEDLTRASDLEPNNTAIDRDLYTVRLKVVQLSVNTILETQGIETAAEIIPGIGTDKTPDPILPAKKHRNPTSTSKDATTQQQSSSSIIWPTVENSVVIEPVVIPPHKRSKKPLVRIQVQDSANMATASSSKEVVPSSSKGSDKTNLQNTMKSLSEPNAKSNAPPAKQSGTGTSTPPAPKLSVLTSSLPKEVPPVPKNSVQFLAAWRQINQNSEMCFQYLKKINGEDFPKIFQDSLDGNILSQILSVLASEFVAANEPVLAYLQGLTQVRRFRTLTLFLSQSDKSNMESLFKHTQNLEKTSSDVLENLKKEYEL